MVDRLSALPQVSGDAHGGSVVLSEISPLSVLQVQAWPESLSAVEGLIGALTGATPPEVGRAALSEEVSVAAIAPGSFVVAAKSLDLLPRFEHVVSADKAGVTDLSHGRTVVRLTGKSAAAVLAKCVAIDLDDSVFPPGRVAATAIHHVDVLIIRRSESVFDLFILRSFAAGLVEWILDAGLEYGIGFVPSRTRARLLTASIDGQPLAFHRDLLR
jgi:sarcosine oxidase subunit gamma